MLFVNLVCLLLESVQLFVHFVLLDFFKVEMDLQLVSTALLGNFLQLLGNLSAICAKLQDKSGSSTCNSCPVRNFSSSNGTTTCSPCSSGFYQNLNASSTCLKCQPGRFASISGNFFCDFCSIGFYQSQNGSASCWSCPNGTFSPSVGCSICDLCQLVLSRSITIFRV